MNRLHVTQFKLNLQHAAFHWSKKLKDTRCKSIINLIQLNYIKLVIGVQRKNDAKLFGAIRRFIAVHKE